MTDFQEMVKKKQDKLADMLGVEAQMNNHLRTLLKNALFYGYPANATSEQNSNFSMLTTYEHTVIALESAVAAMQCLEQFISETPTMGMNFSVGSLKHKTRETICHLRTCLSEILNCSNGSA